MNKKSKKIKLITIMALLVLTTGCTKTLTDNNKKPVKNEATGQTLTENIICKPTNKKTAELYKKNKVKIENLPECEKFKINSGKYEGLWTSFFVKPLAFFLLLLGKYIGNYGVSVIIISLILRYINGYTTFLEGFGYGFLIWTIVNIYDAFVIDICWFCQNSKFVFKGTEDMTKEYRNYWFHIKESFKGEVIALIVCALVGLIIQYLL